MSEDSAAADERAYGQILTPPGVDHEEDGARNAGEQGTALRAYMYLMRDDACRS